MTSSPTFLSKEEQAQIVNAIEAAELITTGEIRVHIEPLCKKDAFTRATTLFQQLNMDQTIERNAVLIYIAFQSRHFAIVGDTGVQAFIPPDYWKDTCEQISASFIKRDYCGAICRAIFSVGRHLSRFFPYKSGDTNELPNEISLG